MSDYVLSIHIYEDRVVLLLFKNPSHPSNQVNAHSPDIASFAYYSQTNNIEICDTAILGNFRFQDLRGTFSFRPHSSSVSFALGGGDALLMRCFRTNNVSHTSVSFCLR